VNYITKDLSKPNFNIELLFRFNLSNKNSLQLFNNSTRDFSNLNVLKCSKSGVIVIEKFVIPENYYEENIHYTNEFKGDTETVDGLIKSKPLEDDMRRYESYKKLIKGSEILDFGCGRGGFLTLANEISKKSIGLELNKKNREYINNIGIKCVSKLSDLNNNKFDLITLNHVFEHLNDPINILIELQKYMKDDGVIIIEVPHARDVLLETFNLESFKKFTLWSEHLILHTRDSLKAFAMNSGLKVKSIEGFQRYPISNHFNWLLNGEPSGHEIFHNLNNRDFHKEYAKFLNTIDQTDTLLGYFSKKK
jgi:2-polyprenyl-3-methyl-5-hydroxy-6-metoxy-1,4-benzoquinol methylase